MDKEEALSILLEEDHLGALDEETALPDDFFSEKNIKYWISKGYRMKSSDYLFIIMNFNFDIWLIDIYFADTGDIDKSMDGDISYQSPVGKYTIFNALEEAIDSAREEKDYKKVIRLENILSYATTLHK